MQLSLAIPRWLGEARLGLRTAQGEDDDETGAPVDELVLQRRRRRADARQGKVIYYQSLARHVCTESYRLWRRERARNDG